MTVSMRFLYEAKFALSDLLQVLYALLIAVVRIVELLAASMAISLVASSHEMGVVGVSVMVLVTSGVVLSVVVAFVHRLVETVTVDCVGVVGAGVAGHWKP